MVSEPRGYKTAPFTATLICPERPDAGSVTRSTAVRPQPTARSTRPVVRDRHHHAARCGRRSESVRQRVTTVTWLFLEDVLRQGTTPCRAGSADRAVNNHKMEYGMRQEIVDGDPCGCAPA